MRYVLRTTSVMGPGHIASGLPNQDYSLIRIWKQSWLAVVSDGMGSRPLSHIGSRLTCKAALWTTQHCNFDTPDRELIQCLYQRWLYTLNEIEIAPDDAVATCLIAWGKVSGECRLLQLGDGMIFTHNSTPERLVNKPENYFGNETTGLGISRKFSDWSCTKTLLTQSGEGIVLMTDGISDDIENPDEFTPAVITSLRGKGARYSKRWMTNELQNWPTPHHTDDKSIAVIYRK